MAPRGYVVEFSPWYAHVGDDLEARQPHRRVPPRQHPERRVALVDVTASNAEYIDATLEIGGTMSEQVSVPAEIGNDALRAVAVSAVGMTTGFRKNIGALPLRRSAVSHVLAKRVCGVSRRCGARLRPSHDPALHAWRVGAG